MSKFDTSVDAVMRWQAVEPCQRSKGSLVWVLSVLKEKRFNGRVYMDFSEGKPELVSLPNSIGVDVRE